MVYALWMLASGFGLSAGVFYFGNAILAALFSSAGSSAGATNHGKNWESVRKKAVHLIEMIKRTTIGLLLTTTGMIGYFIFYGQPIPSAYA